MKRPGHQLFHPPPENHDRTRDLSPVSLGKAIKFSSAAVSVITIASDLGPSLPTMRSNLDIVKDCDKYVWGFPPLTPLFPQE